MRGSPNLDRRVSRIAETVRGLQRAHDAPAQTAAKRRQLLEFEASLAHVVRLFCAPEDAGPGVTRALEIGAEAVAELGYDLPPRQLTEDGIAQACAGRPTRPAPEALELWATFGRLWETRAPGRPPQCAAEAYAYAIARSCGGQFPHYREDD